MIKTCEELNQARVQAQLEIQSYACRILVCSGTGCIATGSHKIHERFEDLVKETPGIELVFSPCGGHDGETVVGVKKTGCQGFCELGPLVRIQKGDKVIQYVKVQPGDCAEIVEKSVLGDEVIERLLYKKGEKVYVQPDEIPFIAKQTRIVLENCGKFDAESLDEYLASGGFDALKKAMFAMTRDEVIDEVDRSGLRGRGGGGFPTGRKWKQVARQKETVRYVVCNGDEGDPVYGRLRYGRRPLQAHRGHDDCRLRRPCGKRLHLRPRGIPHVRGTAAQRHCPAGGTGTAG